MIRPATLDDISAIVGMGQHFLAATPYGNVASENVEQMTQLVEHLIQSESSVIFVSYDAVGLTGMIGMLVFPHPIYGIPTASEVFWWTEPSARGHGIRLFHAAKTWARWKGAHLLQMIAPTPDVETLYQRLGLTKTETLYHERLAG